MKAVLMTENAMIPGVHGLENLNPAINEQECNVHINRDTRPWPTESRIRRAGVSSFGYGGTNGHVIIESVESLYPFYEHGRRSDIASPKQSVSRPFLITMSAHDKVTLQRNIEAHAAVASRYSLHDLAYTLNTRRTKFDTRAFGVVHETKVDTEFAYSAFNLGTVTTTNNKIGFLFTGQGAQWAGVAVEAINTFPLFRQTIRSLDRVLYRIASPPWSLERILSTSSEWSRIMEAEVAQPICTAIQIAIVDLFASWGVTPVVTVGHSSGEMAAAYAAGLITAPEAILAAFYRGKAVKEAAPLGAMLAVGLGVSEVNHYLSGLEETVSVACENSPHSVTLSGTSSGIKAIRLRLEDAKVFSRELQTGKAYHSSQMSPVSLVYESMLSAAYTKLTSTDLEWRCSARARWFSSLTGCEYLQDHVTIGYWSDNLRERVLFDTATTNIGKDTSLADLGCFIEIGPHSALAGPFKQICAANKFEQFKYLPTFSRGQDSAVQLLKCIGHLTIQGHDINFDLVNAVERPAYDMSTVKFRRPRILVDLPPYQWNYDKQFWAEPRFSHEQRQLTHPRHDLLGSKIAGLSDRSAVWRNILRQRDVPWLADHTVSFYPLIHDPS
jgi:acyl transferase domain-containing protein